MFVVNLELKRKADQAELDKLRDKDKKARDGNARSAHK